MLRRYFLLIMIAAVAVIASGCIDSTVLISVNEDGSGKITETVGMNKEVISSMMAMMSEGAEAGEPQSVFKRQDFEEKISTYGQGVTLDSFRTYEAGESEYAEAVYAFEDINNVRVESGGGQAQAQPGMQAEPQDKQYITFDYKKDGKSATLTTNMPESDKADKGGPQQDEAAGQMPDASQMPSEQEMTMMKQMFKGLHFAAMVEVPGQITDTNASHVKGNQVTLFDISFDKFLDDPETLMVMQNVATPQEAAKELGDKAGIKIEPEEKISNTFLPGASAAEAGVTASATPMDDMGAEMFSGIGAVAMGGASLVILVISLIPIAVLIWFFCRIFRKAGYQAALGLLMLIPVVNIIMLMILAFVDWPIYERFRAMREGGMGDMPEPEGPEVPAGEQEIKLDEQLPVEQKEKDGDETEPALPLPSEGGQAPQAGKDKEPEIERQAKPASGEELPESLSDQQKPGGDKPADEEPQIILNNSIYAADKPKEEPEQKPEPKPESQPEPTSQQPAPGKKAPGEGEPPVFNLDEMIKSEDKEIQSGPAEEKPASAELKPESQPEPPKPAEEEKPQGSQQPEDKKKEDDEGGFNLDI